MSRLFYFTVDKIFCRRIEQSLDCSTTFLVSRLFYFTVSLATVLFYDRKSYPLIEQRCYGPTLLLLAPSPRPLPPRGAHSCCVLAGVSLPPWCWTGESGERTSYSKMHLNGWQRAERRYGWHPGARARWMSFWTFHLGPLLHTFKTRPVTMALGDGTICDGSGEPHHVGPQLNLSCVRSSI